MSHKPKLALVALTRASDLLGYSVRLSQELTDEYIPHLLTTEGVGPIESVEVHPICRTYSPRPHKELFDLGNLQSVIRRTLGIDPDLIHFTVTHYWNFLIAAASPAPCVFTIHDFEPHPNEWTSRYVTLYNAIVERTAHRIVFHNKGYVERLRHKGGARAENSVYAPLGSFDVTDVGPVPTDKVILFFGRIRPYKGLEVLLEAMPIVRERHPSAKLIVAGEGSLKAYRALDRLTNGATVEIHNRHVTDAGVETLFRRARVVAAPYTSGTQSGVVALAQSYGRPLVATAVGANEEMLGHGSAGFLVEPKDAAGLADAIDRLLSDHALCRRLADAGRAWVSEHYSPAAMARALKPVYAELLRAETP